MNVKDALYAKLARYVKIDTTSNPASGGTPSSGGQFALGKTLAEELKKLGLKNVTLTKNCYVLAELPANTKAKTPVIGFLAHLDTACDSPGKNVKPKLHKNYRGGKLMINAAKNFYTDPVKNPELKLVKGHDLVTACGDTLLGADDKAGVAIIMQTLEYFKNNPAAKHGTIKIAFTPDEEIGHGSALLPLDKFKADFAYTFDGGVDNIGNGNFNADAAVITVTGVVSHPGDAKGVMVNPLLIASELILNWPKNKRPETTDKERGFIHFNVIEGTIEKVVLKAIVREHDLNKMYKMEKDLKEIAAKTEKKHVGSKIVVEYKKSYRNMKDILIKRPQAMRRLLKALKEEKVNYRLEQARGGTDGAMLSFRGLPTPNIMTGGGGAHGLYEWVSLDIMAQVCRVCVNIACA
jgi:tripeptide aminopeptidase